MLINITKDTPIEWYENEECIRTDTASIINMKKGTYLNVTVLNDVPRSIEVKCCLGFAYIPKECFSTPGCTEA